MMQDHIQKRVLDVTDYVLKTGSTIRCTAEEFGVSKSTIHKDLTERLPSLDKSLAEQIRKILKHNEAQRHIRGGEATRKKYKEAI